MKIFVIYIMYILKQNTIDNNKIQRFSNSFIPSFLFENNLLDEIKLHDIITLKMV